MTSFLSCFCPEDKILKAGLPSVYHSEEFEDSEILGEDCDGGGVALLYSSIGEDSIPVIAWSSGLLQVDPLAEEVQPVWNMDCYLRLPVNSRGHITEMGKICELNSQEPDKHRDQ